MEISPTTGLMYMGYTGADAPALCAAAQAALQRGSPSAPALIQRCADATERMGSLRQ
jgi:SpoVK/Ycf46/Vps4 family AAA+-type ATPase